MLSNYVPYFFYWTFFWMSILPGVYSATDVLSCFAKTPDHALIGYAQDTGNNKVASLEECLNHCLDSAKLFQFDCKSTLFYPDLLECNLNTATKTDDAFSFVETAVGEKVDYYEKTCGVANAASSPPPTSSSSITQPTPGSTVGGSSNNCFQRYPGKSITNVPNNVVPGTTDVIQCQQECAGATVKYQITCKSILWFEQQKGCILVEMRASDVPNQIVDEPRVDYYEYLCGNNSVTTASMPGVTPSLPTIITPSLPTIITPGLPVIVTPPSLPTIPPITQMPLPATGNSPGLRDARIISCFQLLPVQSTMSEDRIFPVTSVDQCADTCTFCNDCLFGQRCNMVAYAISNGHCALSRTIGQPAGLNELGASGAGNILFYARGNC